MIVRVVDAGYLFFREADSFNNAVNSDAFFVRSAHCKYTGYGSH
jgi:hypothetical protein